VSEPRRAALLDAALYGGSALWSLGVALWASIPLYRAWGRLALAPYAVGALAALVLAGRAGTRARAWVAVVVFAGAALLPLALEVTWRAGSAPGLHAQSEAIVTEEAARALVDGRDPYAATYEEGPLAARPLGTQTHFPYLPAMLVFGLPRALDGASPVADARLAFAVATAALMLVSMRCWPTSGQERLRAAQALVILPTGALPMATGGDDLPVLGLMFLSLVLVQRRLTGWGGVAAGLAAGMKQTAWPLLPFLAVAAWKAGGRHGRSLTTAFALVGAALVVPFLAWSPGAFLEDVVLFPLGLGQEATPAGSVTVGTLLVRAFPEARAVLTTLFLLTVAGVAVLLLVHRPAATPWRAAGHAGIVMAVALLLAPAARFGYLIYPVNLVVWAVLLRRSQMAASRLGSPG
jgi:hypothetical protein